MEKRRFWLFVTTENNWKTIKKHSIYGFNNKTNRNLSQLKIKDVVIIYIKGKKMGGIYKIKSLKEKEIIPFIEGIYPYLIKLSKIIVPKEPLDLTPDIIDNISIFQSRPRWGTVLMGRATKEITKEDYIYLMGVIKNGKK